MHDVYGDRISVHNSSLRTSFDEYVFPLEEEKSWTARTPTHFKEKYTEGRRTSSLANAHSPVEPFPECRGAVHFRVLEKNAQDDPAYRILVFSTLLVVLTCLTALSSAWEFVGPLFSMAMYNPEGGQEWNYDIARSMGEIFIISSLGNLPILIHWIHLPFGPGGVILYGCLLFGISFFFLSSPLPPHATFASFPIWKGVAFSFLQQSGRSLWWGAQWIAYAISPPFSLAPLLLPICRYFGAFFLVHIYRRKQTFLFLESYPDSSSPESFLYVLPLGTNVTLALVAPLLAHSIRNCVETSSQPRGKKGEASASADGGKSKTPLSWITASLEFWTLMSVQGITVAQLISIRFFLDTITRNIFGTPADTPSALNVQHFIYSEGLAWVSVGLLVDIAGHIFLRVPVMCIIVAIVFCLMIVESCGFAYPILHRLFVISCGMSLSGLELLSNSLVRSLFDTRQFPTVTTLLCLIQFLGCTFQGILIMRIPVHILLRCNALLNFLPLSLLLSLSLRCRFDKYGFPQHCLVQSTLSHDLRLRPSATIPSYHPALHEVECRMEQWTYHGRTVAGQRRRIQGREVMRHWDDEGEEEFDLRVLRARRFAPAGMEDEKWVEFHVLKKELLLQDALYGEYGWHR